MAKSFGLLGVLGCGNMGGAVARGALRARLVEPAALRVQDPNPDRVRPLVEAGAEAVADPQALLAACDTVVLAVKPQVFRAESERWRAGWAAPKHQIVMSVMAGIKLENLRRVFPGRAVVRVMPNLGLSVGAGATALAVDGSSADALGLAETLFGASGITVRAAEAELDAVTGLSGSGPMYVFEFIEALTSAGTRAGLARDTAYRLALQTAKGSLALLEQSGEAPGVWTERVCSPGGTTLQALRVLQEQGFAETLARAVEAAAIRSRELSA